MLRDLFKKHFVLKWNDPRLTRHSFCNNSMSLSIGIEVFMLVDLCTVLLFQTRVTKYKIDRADVCDNNSYRVIAVNQFGAMGFSNYIKVPGWWFSSTLTIFKASLTFKCMTEHLFADFSCSIVLDTYLWKQMMLMNRKLIHIWYNVDKKHLLFTKRNCHKFSWLFTASRCSPRKRSICACRIACKVLVSLGLYSLSFGFLKKRLPSWKTVFVKRDRWRSPYFRVWFSKK